MSRTISRYTAVLALAAFAVSCSSGDGDTTDSSDVTVSESTTVDDDAVVESTVTTVPITDPVGNDNQVGPGEQLPDPGEFVIVVDVSEACVQAVQGLRDFIEANPDGPDGLSGEQLEELSRLQAEAAIAGDDGVACDGPEFQQIAASELSPWAVGNR